jgi:hypothetical protein
MTDKLTCEAVTEKGLVERYLAGKLSEAETEAFETHYLTCTRCRTELRLGAGIRELLPEVREAPLAPGIRGEKKTGHWFRRNARVGAVAAAVAAVLVGVILVKPAGREPLPHREGVPETVAAPGAEAPRGEVAAVRQFRWAAVPGADLYRVTLYDAAGDVLWQAETSASSLAPPDTVGFVPAELYLWQVDARVGWDRWVSSDLVRFSITGPGGGE